MTYTHVALDSRRVRPGGLYVAASGQKTHGALFVSQAIANGAVAILTDSAGAQLLLDNVDVPVIVSDDPRAELAAVAAELYDYPARHMEMIGVTGTTGKTSTVAIVAAGLAAAGVSTGTIGTLGFSLNGKWLQLERTTITTPESPDLQQLLGQWRDAGARNVVMEVSAHALSLQRVAAIEFDVAAFTNFGHDHLDFYGDRESYFAAKSMLFTTDRAKKQILNVDDSYARRLLRQGSVSVSMQGAADYQVVEAEDVAIGRHLVKLRAPGGMIDFELSLLGAFSVRNAAMAVAIIDQSGVNLIDALPGIAAAQIPGHMERVELGSGAPNVLIDFAHTPESVGTALAALAGQRRIAVLGCGGDRDKEKRISMGQAAALNAEVVIVTDDNPRSEDPAAIREMVLRGAKQVATSQDVRVMDGGDRRAAIALALEMSATRDWVAILGKGHETTQELADCVIAFNDAQVAREIWGEVHV